MSGYIHVSVHVHSAAELLNLIDCTVTPEAVMHPVRTDQHTCAISFGTYGLQHETRVHRLSASDNNHVVESACMLEWLTITALQADV